MYKFLPFLLEALSLSEVNMTKGKYSTVFIQGRFQPPTKAHVQMINEMISDYPESKHYVFVVKGKATSEDKDKNPLDFKLQKELLKKSVPLLGDNIIEVPDAFIGTFVNELRNINCEPIAFYCGSDRLETYKSQVEKYSDRLDINIDIKEVKRGSEDISATKVRQSIKDNDFKLFQSLTTNMTIKEFDMLRKVIK